MNAKSNAQYAGLPSAISQPLQGSILQIPVAETYTSSSKAPQSGKALRLVQNIKKYGLSAPIVVTPTEIFPGVWRYLVVEGEDSWHAACLAGLTQIPCFIAQNTPHEAEINRILAKISEKTVDMFEQAALLRHLADAYALTQEEISRRVGISQSAVANKLRLLQLTAAEQKEILLHGLSERHARALLRLKSSETRLRALSVICRKNLSVSAAEALIESYLLPQTQLFTQKSTTLPEKSRGKFVLHTLQPLYNSLERTLNIFRKTGRNAVLESTQTPDGLTITITIPNP